MLTFGLTSGIGNPFSSDTSAPERSPWPAFARALVMPSVTSTFPLWRVAWGTAMAWGDGTATDATVRELATVGIGGSAVRIRISNLFGDKPLVVGAAAVAQDAGGASIVPGTDNPITFSGQTGVTVPVGQVVYSDAAPMAVTTGETLAVSVYVSGTDVVTVHPCCTGAAVSYSSANNGGDTVSATDGTSFRYSSAWPRWVDAVDVLQSPGSAPEPGSIVLLGDSITDGFNADFSWASVLQKRVDMLPGAQQRAVINEGITANTLTDLPNDYSTIGGGPSGLDRLDQDALDLSGVSTVVVLLGTNDLYFGATSLQVIAGLQDLIDQVHAAGDQVIGVPLLPRMTSAKEPWSATQQTYLQQIDDWILTSHAFDGVINLATVVADDYNGKCSPTSMFGPYDSGDHLHPDDAGQTAMGDAVSGPVLGLPPLPQLPLLVPVTPTPGCLGAVGIPAPSS